jgi:phosphohistidine phosphatase SixA
MIQMVSAQKTTIILLRHAEKDTAVKGAAMMTADPPLSAAGVDRSVRLISELSAYRPDIIYSTDYTRTKSTIQPLAFLFKKEIQLYDPKKLSTLADSLLTVKAKTIIVVGHSNTTPALVNLLIKENKYPALADQVYDQYWIVTIENGMAVATQKKY